MFNPDGTFVTEAFFANNTLGSGAVWEIAFSRDPEQRFIYIADGQNEKVRVVLRETLEEITPFGDGGRYPGQFYGAQHRHRFLRQRLYDQDLRGETPPALGRVAIRESSGQRSDETRPTVAFASILRHLMPEDLAGWA